MKLGAIAEKLGVPLEKVQEWVTRPEFPLSGAESAVIQDVEEWARAAGELPESASERSQEVQQSGESGVSESDSEQPADASESDAGMSSNAVDEQLVQADAGDEVEWINVPIPVVRGTGVRPPSRVMQSVRLPPSDRHVRAAIGMVHAGVDASNQRLSNGKSCNNFSSSYRWLYEQIARVIGGEVDSPR